MTAKKVLSLGQCGVDHPAISRVLRTHFQADVVPAETFDQALDRLRKEAFDLVLVNRILDRNGASGLEFIDRLKADDALRALPVMLVSNYEDAQAQAAERGALPGFGKAALSAPQTLERLRAVLGAGQPTAQK